MNPEAYFKQTSRETIQAHQAFVEEFGAEVLRAAALISETIRQGGKLLIFGNGGSAADAQHMAAEMVGKMLVDRRPLPAIALTTDSSNLTAIGNDYGYQDVFIRQIQSLAKPEDLVLAISTSGNSPNVLTAVEEARKLGCKIITLTGGSGGALKEKSDISLNVSAGKNSSRIQETHIFIIHSLVDLLDRFYLTETRSDSAQPYPAKGQNPIEKGIDL